MSKGLSGIIATIMIVLIFYLSMTTFTTSFLQDNNPDSDYFDYNQNSSNADLEGELNNFTTTITAKQEELLQSEPSIVTFAFLIFEGAFYLPLAFLNLIVSGMNTVAVMIFSFFGAGDSILPGLAVGVFLSILAVKVILLIVENIRTGVSGEKQS